jgi:hypothetical protein
VHYKAKLVPYAGDLPAPLPPDSPVSKRNSVIIPRGRANATVEKIMISKTTTNLESAHPEMDGLHIGVHRKLDRDQGMRKILQQACG